MRQTDYNDFPENIARVIDTDLPAHLQKQALEAGGDELREFIRELLAPHAFINLRRAQSILATAKSFDKEMVAQAAVIAMELLPGVHPKEFRRIIESIAYRRKEESSEEERIIESDQTNAFLRPMSYFNTQITN